MQDLLAPTRRLHFQADVRLAAERSSHRRRAVLVARRVYGSPFPGSVDATAGQPTASLPPLATSRHTSLNEQCSATFDQVLSDALLIARPRRALPRPLSRAKDGAPPLWLKAVLPLEACTLRMAPAGVGELQLLCNAPSHVYYRRA